MSESEKGRARLMLLSGSNSITVNLADSIHVVFEIIENVISPGRPNTNTDIERRALVRAEEIAR